MIFEGSRYAGAAVVRAKASDGKSRPTIYSVTGLSGRTAYRLYPVTAGERLDTIANSIWGDPELWWRIADLNPQLLYPDEIPAGTVLRVPLG